MTADRVRISVSSEQLSSMQKSPLSTKATEFWQDHLKGKVMLEVSIIQQDIMHCKFISEGATVITGSAHPPMGCNSLDTSLNMGSQRLGAPI
jgi:hypothetical protein